MCPFTVDPGADSACMAACLLGNLTSPSHAASRNEAFARLEEALDQMDPIDREVLALRHFEELSNAETAALLGHPAAGGEQAICASTGTAEARFSETLPAASSP